jgi:hypothetical protein
MPTRSQFDPATPAGTTGTRAELRPRASFAKRSHLTIRKQRTAIARKATHNPLKTQSFSFSSQSVSSSKSGFQHQVRRDLSPRPLQTKKARSIPGNYTTKRTYEIDHPIRTIDEPSTNHPRTAPKARSNPNFRGRSIVIFPHPTQHLVDILSKTTYAVSLLLYFYPKRG